MRYAAHLAALLGLLALGVAFGDFASHPNLVGAIGLFALVVALVLALGQLYRPGGIASRNPAPKRPSRPPDAPKPVKVKRRQPVWAEGWDASEADAARERRAEQRRRRR